MFAWTASRTGVQLPSPPAFALERSGKAKTATPQPREGGLISLRFFTALQRLRLGRPANEKLLLRLHLSQPEKFDDALHGCNT